VLYRPRYSIELANDAPKGQHCCDAPGACSLVLGAPSAAQAAYAVRGQGGSVMQVQPRKSGSPGIDLAIEANHRIANNLNALALLLRKHIATTRAGAEQVSRDKVVDALMEVTANILAVSRLHRQLTVEAASGDVELHSVFLNILQAFQEAGLCGDRLRIASKPSVGCMVDGAGASTLALVFSEIVSNAIKYAQPAGVPVEIGIASALLQDGTIRLRIADDGVGFPDGFVEAQDAGVGLKLVRSLVESVGGRLDIKSDTQGVVFLIHLAPRRTSRPAGNA